ncbi:hypothetical protein GHNINEIG_00090 [Hydrogenovibrio crunogenus]|uniref:Uncharacterized protein n=1 Tax=Hydrogenovibrio crunogenus TaxID=39765 RepID=A0A4P7NWV4_9GAMM|nr:hypothetical protein [Hydrogenovibrio crunogenus]QBZ82066.1 hypothetical protein GHNINEIG_00090 [Hydrogenovibrio crunogenus]RUM91877.1 MAG: hypothetical protein DSZ27_04985 [Thiomicrospira sp.]
MKTVNGKAYRHGHGSDEQHKQDQALFSQLLEHHQSLSRETTLIENGIRARTFSEDPHLATVLQEHVAGMEKRFGMGKAIRSWDPLFAALFEYKDDIQMTYHFIENGVEAIITAEDPKLIELIHAHDQTLHGFVEEGFEAGKRESPKPDWLE